MINPGNVLSVEDTVKLKEFKSSAAYSNYLKSVASSPLYTSIMKEHIENINITEDLKKLKSQGKIAEGTDENILNEIFKKSLTKLAVSLSADSIILRELEAHKIDEVINGLKDDSDVTYLLGGSEEKYYVRAKKLFQEGKISSSSLAFKGLVAYTKLHPEFEKKEEKQEIEEKMPVVKPTTKKKSSSIDINSDDIQL